MSSQRDPVPDWHDLASGNTGSLASSSVYPSLEAHERPHAPSNTAAICQSGNSPAADGFESFIYALTLALGDGWSLHTLFADLAMLQHLKGGLTISLSLHRRRQPQFLIYGNFKLCLGAEPRTLNGDRGKHTLYRAASKTPDQVARALKRHLLRAYWRDYAQAKANAMQRVAGAKFT